MVPRNLAGLTESNLVDGSDSELVLCAVYQAGHQELGGLKLFGNITLHPVFRFGSLALHQVADNLTPTIVRWFGPSQTDGALCGIHHLGEGRRSGGIWRGRGELK